MIIEHLVTAMKAETSITDLVAQRIYPNNAPDAPGYPFLVLSKVSGQPEYTLGGRAGIESSRVQVDVYSLQTYAGNVTLKNIVRDFIDGRPPPGPPCVIDQAQCINDIDSPASAVLGATETAGPKKVRRRILEFRVWYR